MRRVDRSLDVSARTMPRRAALGCMLLAGLGVGASLVLLPPGVLAEPFSPAAWPPLLPLAAALLGLLAAGLCVIPAPPPPPAEAPAGTEPILVAALQAAIQDLRGLTEAERTELEALRELYAGAAREAMMVGAQLAGVALDAEARLGSSVIKAEQQLQNPPRELARAAEASLRLERTLPELAELIRRSLERPAGGAAVGPAGSDAAADRLQVVADGMIQALTSTVTDAAGQIEALGQLAVRLRHDAVALDTAGHEIASAGAGVVSRLGEAVNRAAGVLAELPVASRALTEAAATVSAHGAELAMAGQVNLAAATRIEGAAMQAATGLEGVLDRLPDTAAGLAIAATELRGEAASVGAAALQLQQQAASLQTVGETAALRIEAACATAAGAAASLDGLPNAAALLADAAREVAATGGAAAAAIGDSAAQAARAGEAIDTARRGAEAAALALQLQNDTVHAAGEQASEHIAAAAAAAAAAWLAVGRDIAAAGQGVADQLAAQATHGAALLGAWPDVTAALSAAATSVRDETEALRDTARAAAASSHDAAATANALQQQTAALQTAALRTLPEATAALDRSTEMATRRIAGAASAASLSIDTALAQAAAVAQALDRSGHQAIAATDDLRRQGEALQAAADMATTRMAVAIDDAAESAAERAARALAGVPELGADLADAAAALRRDSAALDETGRQIEACGRMVADLLAADADRRAASLDALPRAAARLTAAASSLQDEASGLADTARQLAASGRDAVVSAEVLRQEGAVLAAVGGEAGGAMADAAARAERCVAALDAAGRLISASSAEAEAQIGRLSGLTSDAEAHAAQLGALGEAWRGPPPGTGALLDRLEAVGRRLEQTEAALPDTLQALIHPPAAEQAHAAVQAAREALAGLTGLSAEFGAAASRLDAATSRHDGASAGLEAAIREVRTALEMVADRNGADPSTAPPAATEPLDDVAATLARLAAVEREAVRLLQQTEALANAVISGRAPDLSPLLAARAPGLLAGLDTTIGRLRSAATAVALASDGPAWRGARQGGAG